MINSIFIIVYNKYGIVRGFWGIERLILEWYLKDVLFVLSNDNKRSKYIINRIEVNSLENNCILKCFLF